MTTIATSSLPGSNKLLATYIDDFDSLGDFYAVDYRSPRWLLDHAGRVAHHDYPRPEVAAVLRRQNLSWGAGDQVLQNLEALAEPQSVAIVSGQQVGIFGGPLFTLYKALTCVKLADKLGKLSGVRFVPVFWLAADDDDVAEINRLLVLTSDNRLSPFSCEFDTDERKPLANVHLTENIQNCHRAFAEVISDTEFKDEILGALRQAYANGQSLPDAFARWLTYLMGSLGLVILNPTDPELRRLASRLFLQEVEANSPSTEAVMATSAVLKQRGLPVQVPLRSGHFNMFYVDEYRHALERAGDCIVTTDGELSFSRDDFVGRIREQPQSFSPNVILRPLLQDFLLPSVAYVAGPAETTYFAQLRGVYERFGVLMPAIYPRKSLTLLEKKIVRVLEKYDLHLADFWGPVEELIGRVAKQQAPDGLFEPVAAARDELSSRLSELKTRATALDPTLAGFIDKERGKIFHQLELIDKKLVQAAKKRNEILQQQLRKAANALYPNYHLQERELSLVPFLCKYGKSLIDHLYQAVDLESFDHQVVRL